MDEKQTEKAKIKQGGNSFFMWPNENTLGGSDGETEHYFMWQLQCIVMYLWGISIRD